MPANHKKPSGKNLFLLNSRLNTFLYMF